MFWCIWKPKEVDGQQESELSYYVARRYQLYASGNIIPCAEATIVRTLEVARGSCKAEGATHMVVKSDRDPAELIETWVRC